MTFDEIGAEMGITGERVRQIFDRAIRKLQTLAHREDARELLEMIECQRTYARSRMRGGKTAWVVD